MNSIESTINRIIVGKVEPDEDLIESIIQMIKKHNIKSGLVNCIGALKQFTIGYFDINSKEYISKTFNEYIELISCMGNISFMDDKPVVHLHISIGRRDYTMIGGHLIQPSIVSITGEVHILEIDRTLERSRDPQFDLSLLKI
ncbi:MAG: PPC domain-containing DNA-binding protein [Candidatus Thorarchaeota archaeon]